MFLVDDLLTAPGKAVYFLLAELARKAQEEWLDDGAVKKELQEINALLESGRISEDEFENREVKLVERLQQIAMARLQEATMPEGNPAAVFDVTSAADATVTPQIAARPAATVPADDRPSFSSIAETLGPLLEMVGARYQEQGRRVETGLRVQPLDDLAAACPSFGLTPSPAAASAALPTAPPLAASAVAAAMPPSPPPPPPVADPAPRSSVPLPRPPAGALPIHQVVAAALDGLAMLRLKVSAVTSVSRAEDGWRVTAELVERRGVPDSSDLLGIYELRLDEAGNVLQWERTRLRRRCDLNVALR